MCVRAGWAGISGQATGRSLAEVASTSSACAVDALGADGGRRSAALRELAAALARAVPADWVYGGLALSAALYAALFGLGVAAYRTLYLDSTLPGDRR